MSAYGGQGPMLNAILWTVLVVGALFVGARVYTRKAILRSVGWDDYLIVLTVVIQILYTVFIHIGTGYGIGRSFADVGSPQTYSEAVMWEVFSQVAGLAMIGIGKCSVAMFLLRIVRNKIQVGVIWFCIFGTTVITLFACIGVVVQCIPVQKTWNPTLDGYCWLDFPKLGLTIGSWFVVMDFAFAALPWFVIWDLNMKRKEKITVACGLSLGVFAGICGIVRTVALTGLNNAEYILDTVDMLIWSGVESVVTMMCSSIPVLRPLYVRLVHGSQYGSYGKSGKSGDSTGDKLRLKSLDNSAPKGPSHRVKVSAPPNNSSDESILRQTTWEHEGGIQRTDEISVSYEQTNK
ncbi:hypothetical protein F4778DRAFT_477734 [Xylariomycetidae sp. FL2044]|nr:hypothetical protein F4778DRAFT_477734 [Xylariomycetidae sp. FL2044]